MRSANEQTRDLILDLATDGGALDAVYVADLMYDGERRLKDVQTVGTPSLSWDRKRFVAGSGGVTVLWADDFGSSMIPREIGDWFSPFGAELQVDMLIRAGRYEDRIPMGRYVISDVPEADDRRTLFQGRRITAGESFRLDLADRLAKVAQDEFRRPTRASSTSAWQEIQSITGFPILRNLPDAAVPSTIVYEGDKTQVLNQLFDALGGWPHLTPDGVLTALPKAWGAPVDEIRGVVSAPVSLSPANTYNVVIVEGKDAAGEPIYAEADITEGFLRVRQTDGSVSPFGQKPHRYQDNLGVLNTYEKCAKYAEGLLGRVSRVQGVTRLVREPLNPLREIGDVLSWDGRLVRAQTVKHDRATTEMLVEVSDE